MIFFRHFVRKNAADKVPSYPPLSFFAFSLPSVLLTFSFLAFFIGVNAFQWLTRISGLHRRFWKTPEVETEGRPSERDCPRVDWQLFTGAVSLCSKICPLFLPVHLSHPPIYQSFVSNSRRNSTTRFTRTSGRSFVNTTAATRCVSFRWLIRNDFFATHHPQFLQSVGPASLHSSVPSFSPSLPSSSPCRLSACLPAFVRTQ